MKKERMDKRNKGVGKDGGWGEKRKREVKEGRKRTKGPKAGQVKGRREGLQK